MNEILLARVGPTENPQGNLERVGPTESPQPSTKCNAETRTKDGEIESRRQSSSSHSNGRSNGYKSERKKIAIEGDQEREATVVEQLQAHRLVIGIIMTLLIISFICSIVQAILIGMASLRWERSTSLSRERSLPRQAVGTICHMILVMIPLTLGASLLFLWAVQLRDGS